MLNFFYSIFAPPDPAKFAIGCVLPPPVAIRKPAARPKEVVTDVFLEDAGTNRYGFNLVTAIQNRREAVKELTEPDIQELAARDLWSDAKTYKGQLMRANNARAKALWSEGKMALEIAKLMGFSPSWAEKRSAAFEAALKAAQDVAK